MQSNCWDIDAIYCNLTSCRFNNPEQCLNESRFTTACSAYNASFHPSCESACETLQDKRHLWGIADLHQTIIIDCLNTIKEHQSRWYKTTKITWRSRISTSPCDGQEGSGRFSSITRGGSLGIEVYWRILSTDIIMFSKLQKFHITQACNILRLSPYVTAKPAIALERESKVCYKILY